MANNIVIMDNKANELQHKNKWLKWQGEKYRDKSEVNK